MGMVDENYIPFGDEWEKTVMKHSKKELVSMYKEVCQQKLAVEGLLKIHSIQRPDLCMHEWMKSAAYKGAEVCANCGIYR